MIVYRPGSYSATVESHGFYGHLTLSETSYMAGSVIPRHAHAQAAFVLVVDGALVEYGADTLECAPGTVIFRNAEVPHRDRFVARSRCFNVELGDAMAKDVSRYLPSGKPVLFDGARAFLSEIYEEYALADEHSALAIDGLVRALVARSSRTVASSPPAWLVRARRLMLDISLPSHNVSEIAALIGVSASHLTRCYRRYFKTSASKEIRRRRLEHAKRLIMAGMPLPEVASCAGYADQSHMTKAFRSIGTTPARYAASKKLQALAFR
jgi:AraC-like DNA-binding protein